MFQKFKAKSFACEAVVIPNAEDVLHLGGCKFSFNDVAFTSPVTPLKGDAIVRLPDGFVYYCPAEVFTKHYEAIAEKTKAAAAAE
jgi:hypothetical protein